MGLGIICGCLPSFRSLIEYIFPRLKMKNISTISDNTASYQNQVRFSHKRVREWPNVSTTTFIELGSQDGDPHGFDRGINERAVS
jgi:hypothetical protein